MAPYLRTPQAVDAVLLQEPDRPALAARPVPMGQALQATREGKAGAMTRLVPHPTLVLEMLHATAYRWDTANALLGERPPGRTTWVRTPLEQGRAGPTEMVLTTLAAAANDPRHTETPRRAVLQTLGSDQRHRPSRRYEAYLARGWPMGTGGVEGAGGHLVQERMEQAGRRWTTAGAQAVLDLRAVRINGPWDAYGQLHRQQHHQRVHGTSTPVPEMAEAQGLALAA